ncbi:MAG: 2OG-Fe(II) oxygenase [Bacteroidetes bacterium]|nr:2OG-Fe(II) oxygenase [Bacteroidota bacterium]
MKNPTAVDWIRIIKELNEQGFATIPSYWSAMTCKKMQSLYLQEARYRSTIQMERYRFGRGQYKYFSYPLPDEVQQVREEFYPPLSVLANEWMVRLGQTVIYPAIHQDFIRHCHDAGQERPTCLILTYAEGGYNTLHQDLYGEVYFPFQVLFVLSEQGMDYEGGEFVLTEQLPRAQSRAHVIHPKQGDAIIFTTNFRPVEGSRGFYKSRLKHGVATVTKGNRSALGIIFHDAA